MGKNSLNELSPKLIEKAMRIAAETAIEHLEKEKIRQQKAKRDRRLRNIKLLLRNYRSFVKHGLEIKEDLETIQSDKTVSELYADDFAIESIMRSKQRTLVMVQFMKKMVSIYRVMCEESESQEELRRYQVIHAMFISEEKITVEKIAECHFVDKRTIFRDVNKACETLSVLIFGVDAIHLE